LVLVPAASAKRGLAIGAAEDMVKRGDLGEAKAQLELAAAAGMNAIRVTALWRAGQTAPDPGSLAAIATTSDAATLTGIRMFVSVYPAVNREAPLDDTARRDFASFTAALATAAPGLRDFIIGNEPNLNYFWLPQYDLTGASASPAAYTALLAGTYDALKAVDPEIDVIGGSVSPAGTDKPFGKRPTHSPGRFVLGMGAAYRALGRTTPIMDAFAFHPYGPRSSTSPLARNPRSSRIAINDYGKLTAVLGRAFDGTAQAGSTLPIVYDEYGVQTRVPKRLHSLYSELESPVAEDAVSEATQARYYREALALALCQPNVEALLFFHLVDETDARRWQSGVLYPDLTPKRSFAPVREAILEARNGTISRCGLPPTLWVRW
jgi:hypothetical protein